MSAPEFFPYALVQYLISDNEKLCSRSFGAEVQHYLIYSTVHNTWRVIVEVAFKTKTNVMNHATEPLRAVFPRGINVRVRFGPVSCESLCSAAAGWS